MRFAAICFALMVLSGCYAHADEPTIPFNSKLDQPLYIVTQNHYGEGEGANDAKFSDVLAIEIAGTSVKPAPKLPLFSHGKKSGELLVHRKVSVECEGTGLTVKLPKGFGFSVSGFALASAARNFPERDNGLRKVNASEEKEFIALAKKRFADKKDFNSWDPKGKTELLGAVYMKASKDLEYIVGTVKSTSEKELDTVFVIARVKGKELIPEKVISGISADLEDGQDLDFTTYAEQVDLDGDGVDEIITENRGYESKSFTIWKRKGGKWEEVGAGGESGC